MNCLLDEQRDEQYETVTNGSEHEARNRHVAVNSTKRLRTRTSERRETAMNECECRKVTVNG